MSIKMPLERPAFSFVGGRPALDFVNTISWSTRGTAEERFLAFHDVLAWGLEAKVISPDRHDRLRNLAHSNAESAYRALQRTRLVRELLYRLFSDVVTRAAPDPSLIGAFNDRLARSLIELRLSDRADALIWTERDDDLDAVLHPAIWSTAQILSSADRDHLRRCAGDGCGWLFVDESRNHKRRWCEMRECGNRAKARRYYARHRNRSQDS